MTTELSLTGATWVQDGEGRNGTETGHSAVLDDAPGMGLSAVEQVRFAGQPGNRDVCRKASSN
jgi:hypothetical protein